MFVITAATGQLGSHVINHLLERVPASDIAVVVRDSAKAAHLTDKGIDVRIADYSDPEALASAFKSGEKVLLISGTDFGNRLQQQSNVITAATNAGVALLAYTSVLRGPDAGVALADEHIATEEFLTKTGIPFVLLRNGWYHENYTDNLAPAIASGGVLTNSAEGARIASASRRDLAEAAAVVLTTGGHENKIYELSGDEAWSFEEYAEKVSTALSQDFIVNRVPSEVHQNILVEAAGLPVPLAEILIGVDDGISNGFLSLQTGDLGRLIGHPTEPIDAYIASAVAKLGN